MLKYTAPIAAAAAAPANQTKTDGKLEIIATIFTRYDFALAIAEQAGAEVLTPRSCHNLTKADFESGETYLSLMKKNVPALRKGLYW
jgi:zinc transport system substrate-binding protein